MQKAPSHTNHGGFSLIELIISAALVLLFATMFTNAVLAGQESASVAGRHARATLLAEEGLEAARNIRDAQYSNLADGTYGIGLSSSAWAFVGSSDTQDIFTRTVQISTVDAVTKQVTSKVSWPEIGRTASTTLTTYLTNLDTLPNARQADVLLVDASGAQVGGSSSTDVQNFVLQNTGASSITITKMKISWSPSSSKLIQIMMNGSLAWSNTGPGSPSSQQSSGATTTLQSVAIAAGDTIPLNKLVYTGNMHNNSFTLVFTFSDNSQKTVTVPVLP